MDQIFQWKFREVEKDMSLFFLLRQPVRLGVEWEKVSASSSEF